MKGSLGARSGLYTPSDVKSRAGCDVLRIQSLLYRPIVSSPFFASRSAKPRVPRQRFLLCIRAVHADYQAKAGDSAVLQRPLKAELFPSEIRDVFGYPRNFKDVYSLSGVLGAGSFGVVRECTERSTGRRYAVKSIPKTPKNGKATPRYLLKLQTEVDAMNQLGASLDAVYLKDVFEDDAAIHIVMELCEGGSVLEHLRAGEYSERQAAEVMRAVLRFLSQCHAKGIVYRDVKPENFMLLGKAPESAGAAQKSFGNKPDGGNKIWNRFTRAVGLNQEKSAEESFIAESTSSQQSGDHHAGPHAYNHAMLGSPVKATDFGLSIRHRHGEAKLKSRSGTPAYMAPEVIGQQYDEKADVWSAGIMMYQLLTGKFPFWDNVRDCTLQQVWKSILNDRIDFEAPELRQISPSARDLLRGLLHRSAEKRLTASEALRHPWLRSEGTASSLPLRSSVVQRLQRFATYGRLKQLVFHIIADEFSQRPSTQPEARALVEALTGLFHELDVDASGSVSMDELLNGLERLGYDVTSTELEHLMRRVDSNHDGSLQLGEFVAGLVDWPALQKDSQWGAWVGEAFARLDRNADGFISLSSLEELLEGDVEEMGEREVGEDGRLIEARRMLREADTNGDGRVSREEFADLLTTGSRSDGLAQYDPRLIREMPLDLASVDEELETLDVSRGEGSSDRTT